MFGGNFVTAVTVCFVANEPPQGFFFYFRRLRIVKPKCTYKPRWNRKNLNFMPVTKNSGVDTEYMQMSYANKIEWVRYRELPSAVRNAPEKSGLVLYHAGKRISKEETDSTLKRFGVPGNPNELGEVDIALYFTENKLCELLMEIEKGKKVHYIFVYFDPSNKNDGEGESFDEDRPLNESLSMAYSVLAYETNRYKFAGALKDTGAFVKSETIAETFGQRNLTSLFDALGNKTSRVIRMSEESEKGANSSDMFLVFEMVSHEVRELKQQKKLVERFLRAFWEQKFPASVFIFLFGFFGSFLLTTSKIPCVE